METIPRTSSMTEVSQHSTPIAICSVEPKRHRIRRRTHHIRKWIISKFEFLFGEPNWRRDRHLQALAEASPDKGVLIEDILKFPSFTKEELKLSAKYVATVLRQDGSSIVKLSADEKRICHKVEPVAKENAKECTIFVDRIPGSVDLSWMEKQFSRYGPIEYIKLPRKQPRFGASSDNKCFGFVEYAKPGHATLAVQAFSHTPAPLHTTAPADAAGSSHSTAPVYPLPASRRRRRAQSECTGIMTTVTSCPPKIKKCDAVCSDSVVEATAPPADVASSSTTTEVIPKKKRHRRRKKSKARRRGHHVSKAMRGVKVFSYFDFEKMKKQYKSIQKANVAKAKRQLALRIRARRAETVTSPIQSPAGEVAAGHSPSKDQDRPVRRAESVGPIDTTTQAHATEIQPTTEDAETQEHSDRQPHHPHHHRHHHHRHSRSSSEHQDEPHAKHSKLDK